MSKINIKVDSSWKNIKSISANVSNTWKNCIQTYVNVGSWKPIWNYMWSVGGWSNCSVICGGGYKPDQ